ncbi:hypothetical protein JW890_01155 [candidate division WOR-3 bacterium]|nr:hypothetical protein [candidate division WOR-3 bacterium]
MIFPLLLFIISSLNPEPPQSVKASDAPDDMGGVVTVSWARSASDTLGNINNVWGYRIFRIQPQTYDTQFMGFRDRWSELVFTDSSAVNGTLYIYGIQTKSSTGTSDMAYSGPVKSRKSLFRERRLAVAVAVIAAAAVFLLSKEKSSDFFKRKNVEKGILWAMEKGKTVMVIMSYEELSSRKGISRTLNDLKWMAEKIISSKGEIRVLAPGHLERTAFCVFRDVYMKDGRLKDFNPLWIRRTWSGGVSYSGEACRLLDIWKPGLVLITGEPGVWTFPVLKKCLLSGAQIAGIKTGLNLLPAVLASGVGIENISGSLSEVFFPGLVLKKYLYTVIFLVSFLMIYMVICWMFAGTEFQSVFLSLRDFLSAPKAMP